MSTMKFTCLKVCIMDLNLDQVQKIPPSWSFYT